jgi:hypothetical protein
MESGYRPVLETGSMVAGIFFGLAGSEATHCSKEAMLGSSIPSAKLEQQAQMLGFRDKALLFSPIGSPQQMQTLGFIHATSRIAGR